MTIITESKENNATYTSDMMQRKVFTPLRGKCAYRKEWHKNPIDLIDVPGGENVLLAEVIKFAATYTVVKSRTVVLRILQVTNS
jgi:hypothetical protein